jgi:hypothetical protein
MSRRRKWIIDGARTTARELARMAGRGGSAGLALRISGPARERAGQTEAQVPEDPPQDPPAPTEPAAPSASDQVDDAELARIRGELAEALGRLADRDSSGRVDAELPTDRSD